MYGSYVIGTDVEDGVIKSLSVANKSGIADYFVKSVVDATGDADIAEFAGAPTETYKPGNIIAAWYYYTENGKYDLKILGNSSKQKDLPADDDLRKIFERRFGGIDAKEISEMVKASHKLLMYNWLERREKDERSVISTIATIPQLRMTRRIVGEYTLDYEEMHKRFEDSVGMVSDWRKRGPIFEVPFRTLYNSSVKNLIAAGRCTSVTDELWDVMRVIPCCAVTGQAAGTAAAMTDDFAALDVSALQKKLENNGVILHESSIIEN